MGYLLCDSMEDTSKGFMGIYKGVMGICSLQFRGHMYSARKRVFWVSVRVTWVSGWSGS